MNKSDSVLFLLGIYYNTCMLQMNSPIYGNNDRWGLKVQLQFVFGSYYTHLSHSHCTTTIKSQRTDTACWSSQGCASAPTGRSSPLFSDTSLSLPSPSPLPPPLPPQILVVSDQHKFLFWTERKKASKDLKEELNNTALIRAVSLSKYLSIAPEYNHHLSQIPASLWKTSYKIKQFHRATRLRSAAFQKSDSLFCPENYAQAWCARKA